MGALPPRDQRGLSGGGILHPQGVTLVSTVNGRRSKCFSIQNGLHEYGEAIGVEYGRPEAFGNDLETIAAEFPHTYGAALERARMELSTSN